MSVAKCPSCGADCPFPDPPRYWICTGSKCLTAHREPSDPAVVRIPADVGSVESFMASDGPKGILSLGESLLDSDPSSWMGWYCIGRSAMAQGLLLEGSLCWRHAVGYMDRSLPDPDGLASHMAEIMVSSFRTSMRTGRKGGAFAVAGIQEAMIRKFGRIGYDMPARIYHGLTEGLEDMPDRDRFPTFFLAAAEWLNGFELEPDIRRLQPVLRTIMEKEACVPYKVGRFSLLKGAKRKFNGIISSCFESVEELDRVVSGILSDTPADEIDRLTGVWSARVICSYGGHALNAFNYRLEVQVKEMKNEPEESLRASMDNYRKELDLFREEYLNPPPEVSEPTEHISDTVPYP